MRAPADVAGWRGELWGAYYGLLYAWETDFHQIVLALDSLEAVEILKDDVNGSYSLMWHLRELCSHDWNVQILHTKRDRNKVTDALTRNANDDSLNPVLYDSLSFWLNTLLLGDVNHAIRWSFLFYCI
ncbi:hypothetical protein V6N12_010620 [Hibiscus sabdariffa]|uniref:RNase H type-1 domain-containing protein n=1 Tax=Hibiscus sabdariffa TaxID=183260 RepID=A0ABR2EKL9_9ROSI